MRNPWKHRLALSTAALMFVLVGVGAHYTGALRGTRDTPGLAAPGPAPYYAHLGLAGLVLLLTIVLALQVRTIAGWIALTGALIVSGIGGHGPVLHAMFSPILFAALVAVAVETSDAWSRPPVPAPDMWPPLRRLMLLTPLFVVLQTFLGAAFRHNVLGVIWHILDAGIVLLLVMMLGVCVVRQFPGHPSLRPVAVWMLTITGIQVALGFTVYLTILIVSKTDNLFLICAGVLHVLTGSLTLAATVVMWLELQRCDNVTNRSITV